MPKFFRFPWASTGDKTIIPDETDVAGFVSYQQGYGNDYARDPASDPLAKLIERDKMNQLYSDLTENVQYWQTHSFPEYITAAQNGGVAYAYDIGAIVRYDDGGGYKVYQNETAGNTNLPTGAGWVLKEGIAGLNAPDFVGPVTIDGYNVSPFSGFKNHIINGNFTINQRAYVSGTATTTANQYIFDRWRIPTSGQSATFTTTNGITTVTAPASGIEQVIENLNIVDTTYTLSYTGTATPTVSQASDNITYTPITPNADGSYTVTSGNYIKVNLASGTVSKVQFEPGSVATPFEQRPYGLELSLCQRYLPTLEGGADSYVSTFGKQLSATTGVFIIPTKVHTRVPITGIFVSPLTHYSVLNPAGDASFAISTLSVSAASTVQQMVLSVTFTANGGAAGQAMTLLSQNASAKLYGTGCEL